MRTSVGFCLVEVILLSLVVFCLALLTIALYNSVVADKITLIKSEWVCTDTKYKLSIIGGKVYNSNDCIKYIKEK